MKLKQIKMADFSDHTETMKAYHLGRLADELKRTNDLKERELRLKEREIKLKESSK